jgi:hypothetical protein
MDMSQVNMPLRVGSQQDWQVGPPGNAAPESIEERGARFEKLMAADIPDRLPSAQPDNPSDALKTDSVPSAGQTTPVDGKIKTAEEEMDEAVKQLLETVKKELSATEFKNLKEGWVGVNGSEYQFGQSYLLFMNEVVNQGTQIYNFLKDNLENP